jgi:dimethylargininase
MLTAITRPVSASINRCELGYLPRREIDFQKAAAQHAGYEACLAGLGLGMVSLAAEPELPDAVFVEDAAVVVDEIAVMTRMGAASRRPEAESVARELARYRPVRRLREPATLDGGDVMHAGRTLYVGASRRTNAAGIRRLADELEPFGYSVAPVEIRDCLHMKSACCYLGKETILANRAWIDPAPFRNLRILDVAQEEPWAANVLAIGEAAILPSCFPVTQRILEREGWNVIPVDVSEIMKAEGGVTCMSLILEVAGQAPG